MLSDKHKVKILYDAICNYGPKIRLKAIFILYEIFYHLGGVLICADGSELKLN